MQSPRVNKRNFARRDMRNTHTALPVRGNTVSRFQSQSLAVV